MKKNHFKSAFSLLLLATSLILTPGCTEDEFFEEQNTIQESPFTDPDEDPTGSSGTGSNNVNNGG